MIIGFAGRMRSGKTELAKVCEKHGFEKLYFALPLKQLCADLLEISIDELNRLKAEKEAIGITFDDDFCRIISDETDIPLETVHKYCDGVVIKDVRHMLQFIGTDLIRNCNTNWHVNRIREMINPSKNYVFDDVRFPNELNLIRELGGDCWFVIRPRIDNISNHESETALTWRDFDNKLIINDSNLERFLFKWETFLKDYDRSLKTREEYLKEKDIIKLYGDVSEPLSVFELLEISTDLFKYKPRNFDCKNIEKISNIEGFKVDVEYKDGSHEIVSNPVNLEDLKVCINNN